MKSPALQITNVKNPDGAPLIFIVHKDDTYRRLMLRYLTLAGYHSIRCFASGAECMHYLHLYPALVITEYNLEGPSGFVLLQNIKQQINKLPVIIFSGQDDISIATKAIQYGAFDYIVKNKYAFDNLNQSIEHLLSLNKKLNRNRRQYLAASVITFMVVLLLILLISWYNR